MNIAKGINILARKRGYKEEVVIEADAIEEYLNELDVEVEKVLSRRDKVRAELIEKQEIEQLLTDSIEYLEAIMREKQEPQSTPPVPPNPPPMPVPTAWKKSDNF